MSLDAGSVFATLGGKVDPSGFAQFGRKLESAAASADRSEGRISNAFTRSREAGRRLQAQVERQSIAVEQHAVAQQRAAAAVTAAQTRVGQSSQRVERAQANVNAATSKYGAESQKAQAATAALAAAQDRHRAETQKLNTAHAQLGVASRKAEGAQRDLAAAQKASAASVGMLGTVARTGGAAGLLALAAGTVYSVKKSRDLQKALSEVQAVTRAGPAAMGRYKQAAIELGTSTGVGAATAASALAELAKGGLSVDDTLTALKGTIALAQAGGMDLSTAATTVAQSLNLFNMKGSEATRVADSFANAANATTADVDFFAQGMAQGGAAAKAAGLNFDQTTVALEMMAANGFKSGSDAGTSLKTTLTQIAHPTKQAREEMKKLGLDFFGANGQIKSVGQISAMLGDKLGGLTKKQRLAAAATIAGTDGMRALLALYDQGPGKAAKFAKANEQSGTAARTAADKTNNLEGNLQKLKAQIDALAISAGDTLVPAFTKAAKAATKFFDDYRKHKSGTTGGDTHSIFEDMIGGAESFISTLGEVGDWTGGNLFQVLGRMKQDMDYIFSGFDQHKDPFNTLVNAKLDAGSLKHQLGNVAGLAGAAGVSQVNIRAIMTGDADVRVKIAALTAEINGIPPAVVQSIMNGDGGVKAKVLALDLMARGIAPATVMAIMGGDDAVKVKIAALSALARGVSSASVYAAIRGDNSVKVKLAALAAASRGIPPAAIRAAISGNNSVRVKLAALDALAAGLSPALVRAAITGTASVKTKLAVLDALAAGISPAVVRAVMTGQGGVKTKIAALYALASGAPPAQVRAIISGDGPAKGKIRALDALKISPKTATVTGNAQSAFAAITGVRSQLGSINGQTANTYIYTHHIDIYEKRGKRAAGRAPAGGEIAEVGEGGGPEWVGNPTDGFRRYDRPTIVGLDPADAVIPTESMYAGNALRFLRSMVGRDAEHLAHQMGVSGYNTEPPPVLLGKRNREQRLAGLELMQKAWAAAAPFYGQEGSSMPRVQFTQMPLVGTMYDPGKRSSTQRVYWPDWVNEAFLLPPGQKTKDGFSQSDMLAMLVHEWAHYFQGGKVKNSTDAEGGAQLFARRVTPKVAAALGIDYHNSPWSSDQYPKEMLKAKRHGEDWIMRGQFTSKKGYAGTRPRYKKGRPPKETESPAVQAKWAERHAKLPRHLDPLRYNPDDLNTRSSRMLDAYNARKDHVKSLETASHERDSKKRLTKKAKSAANELPKARRQAASARKRWLAAKDDAAQAKRYAALITKEETKADNATDDMTYADGKHDEGLWNSATAARRKALTQLKGLLEQALKAAPKGSQWALDLQKRIGTARNDLQTLDTGEMTKPEAQTPTALTAGEQGWVDYWNAQIGLAQVNTPDDVGDDIKATQGLIGVLEGALKSATATSGAGRGGWSAIADISGQLKSARDSVESMKSGGAGGSSDLQAQLDQANAKYQAAQRSSDVNAAVLAAFQSDPALAPGGPRAGFVQNNYMLHPADSTVLAGVADAATRGIDRQGIPSSNRMGVA